MWKVTEPINFEKHRKKKATNTKHAYKSNITNFGKYNLKNKEENSD